MTKAKDLKRRVKRGENGKKKEDPREYHFCSEDHPQNV